MRTDALLVRRVPYGEADLIVTLFTEGRGIVAAAARSARRSARRFSAIEPMHLLSTTFDERPGAELASLVEVSIARPRLHLTQRLDALDAAGRALRWVREASPPHTPEPELWAEVNALLDALDDPEDAAHPDRRLAAMGLRMLGHVGWALELDRCVRCGRPCDEGASACVDPAAGGLVCRACGGARVVLRGGRRGRLAAAAAGADDALEPDDASITIDLVEQTLAAHAGVAR